MALSKAADVAGTVSNLSVYFGQQAALENINMQIHRRRINVLSGPSGSGKTTLLRALNRLNDEYQHSRTRGEITLCVADKPLSVNQLKTTELPYLRRKVGMVFQHPQLLPGSVAQNLLLPLKVVGNLQGEAALKQMQQAFEQAALWDEVKDRLSASASTLSGGQQQRLCLARTLVFEPDILLLDEPTSSLDPEATAQVEALIKRLAGHCTLVMVSHCEHQTARLADHLYRFEYGRLRPESA